MTDVVRAALVQTTWTGDKESMIKAHEDYARDAGLDYETAKKRKQRAEARLGISEEKS